MNMKLAGQQKASNLEIDNLTQELSGHYSRDWSEYVNVIGVISEPFAHELR